MANTWTLPVINLLLCDRCGTCVERCPTGAVKMSSDGPVIANPSDCSYCAACEEACPQHAISCTFEIVWGATSPSETTG